jgi:hypothetical protein
MNRSTSRSWAVAPPASPPLSVRRASGLQNTLLLDRRAAAGGTGGFSGLTTLCGLFDDEGRWLNDGFAREFAGKLAETPSLRMGKVWVLPYRPEGISRIGGDLLASTPNLQARWNTPLVDVAVEGDRITGLNGIRRSARSLIAAARRKSPGPSARTVWRRTRRHKRPRSFFR